MLGIKSRLKEEMLPVRVQELLKIILEKNLCKRVKKNPKAFYMYVNNKTKTRSKILLLLINHNKSMGPDEVHPRILKESAEVIYFPLDCILRQVW